MRWMMYGKTRTIFHAQKNQTVLRVLLCGLPDPRVVEPAPRLPPKYIFVISPPARYLEFSQFICHHYVSGLSFLPLIE